MISVLILTKNEEQDLPVCLESVRWSDDVHVFDSFSTDNTMKIAQEYGAKTLQREFDNYAAQRNAALEQAGFKHHWVLILDADERIPEDLATEMFNFVGDTNNENYSACRIRRRDFLGSTWLKHVQASPYYLRLVVPDKVHYEREINEVLHVDGPIYGLTQPFDHYPFSKGMAHWLHKHNIYSSMEAMQVINSRKKKTSFSFYEAFFNRDFNQRRFHQKELFYRLSARPFIKFMILYFLKRGFLDGRAGFTYAILQSFYEYMIVLKTREQQAR